MVSRSSLMAELTRLPLGARRRARVKYFPGKAERRKNQTSWCLYISGSLVFFNLISRPRGRAARHVIVVKHFIELLGLRQFQGLALRGWKYSKSPNNSVFPDEMQFTGQRKKSR